MDSLVQTTVKSIFEEPFPDQLHNFSFLSFNSDIEMIFTPGLQMARKRVNFDNKA